MTLSDKEWIWPDHDRGRVDEFAKKIDLPGALARLLINRGIDDPGQARAFLSPSRDNFYSPWLMLGMEETVARLLDALQNKEKIMIHGDYDADGISATVILVEALQRLGGEVEYYLPSRFDEGYGLHIEPLTKFIKDGVSLVVTVDCGINAVKEAAFAAENGLDLIVTDHHQPLDRLNGAFTVINPLQPNCPYPFKELSGAGIAFKLASALMEKSGSAFPEDLLDLAALGTVADVVPLLDENRLIVATGLEILRSLKRVGFRALVEAVRLEQSRINSRSLSFILAPSVNAAGRMGEALPAAMLLLEKDSTKAAGLAAQLHQANQKRRLTEQEILKEAEEAATALLEAGDDQIITLAGEGWHHGVIGIVASRLVERFNRPVALISLENGEGRGSARSVPGFDITAALADSASLLERFGGHEQAAGFSLQPENVAGLRAGLNRYAGSKLTGTFLNPALSIEAELEPAEIEQELVTLISQLQPFGMANPVPVFGSRSWELESWRLVGTDKKHLKINVNRAGKSLAPIIFSGAELVSILEKGRRVDLAFRLKNGFYRDQKTIDVEVSDLRYSDILTSGNLILNDLRGTGDRPGSVKKILSKQTGKTAIFVLNQVRADLVRANCPRGADCSFITSGSFKLKQELNGNPDRVILFDLPLHGNLLKPIFEKVVGSQAVEIYLLYSSDDLMRNNKLIDHILPADEHLETVIEALGRDESNGLEPHFPGPALDSFDFKTDRSFWDRASGILHESGFLVHDRLFPGWEKLRESWPQCLESSSAYLETMKLRKDCKQFQKLLLAAPLDQLAVLLRDLN